jgi:hypothetical protein
MSSAGGTGGVGGGGTGGKAGRSTPSIEGAEGGTGGNGGIGGGGGGMATKLSDTVAGAVTVVPVLCASTYILTTAIHVTQMIILFFINDSFALDALHIKIHKYFLTAKAPGSLYYKM